MMYARHYTSPTWLQAAAFAPALRADVRFVPHRDQFLRLYDPTMRQYVQLYRLECHIAQLMNGQRSLDELTAIAQRFSSEITREAIEYFVVNLNAVGLLDRSSAPAPLPGEGQGGPDALEWQSGDSQAFVRPPILAQPAPVAPPPTPVPHLRVVNTSTYQIPDQPTLLSEADALSNLDDDDMPDFDAALSGVQSLPQAEEAEHADETEQPDEAAAEAAPEGEEAPADGEEPVADGSEEAPADGGLTPEEIAAQEQEALLAQERTRAWHQKTWVRALAALVVIIGVAAVVPYPLRVNSECTLIPSQRVKVRSELPGVLSEVLVDEGQPVKKGDVIARIDDRALKADRLKTLAEIEKIQAEIAILKQGHRKEEIQQQAAILAARRNEVAFAAKEANRRAQMAKEGVGSRQAVDEAARELETHRRSVAEAEAALRLLKAGSRPEEISAQEAVLKRAQAELTYIDERLTMTAIRAPIDGTVTTPRFHEHVNEGVEAGGLVCEIANTSKMRAEIMVSEREVDVIRMGMPVTVKVESYPTHPFVGKVDFIAPTVDGDDKRVRVVVELDNADGMLKANMTGYGEVEAGKRSLLDLATRRVVRWVRVRFLI